VSHDVLVIGGSGGIGHSIVRRFAQDGASVLFTYLKSESDAHAVADDCAHLPGRVSHVQLDVRDEDGIARVLDCCGDELSTLVFAAASGVLEPLRAATRRHWDWTLAVNVRAFGLLCRDAVAHLRRRQGCVVALTALGSRRYMPDYSIVGPAKAAIETIVRYGAVEAGGVGVRVNAVCPGVVETKALRSFPEEGRRIISEAQRTTPLGRLVTPAEVAEVVHWLSGDSARMITGQMIVVDGGWELIGSLTWVS
jgi:enoyl-[acyl-carrier protein] reductase III